MNRTIILAVARRFFRLKFVSVGMLVLLSAYVLALGGVTYERWQSYTHEQEHRTEHQARDRESWESNPDKHPHRMAHFGAFVFRVQHPLSIFDAGLESYMGNVIFLEAHKQNTANFSEASLATGLVRFGDLHVAMLLYLILPLFIFFVGFDSITRERELRTIKLMYIQGAEIRDIICGKALGLFAGASLFFLPAFGALWSMYVLDVSALGQETLLRILLLCIVYVVFFLILCLLTVLVSAWSRTSTQSLLSLLGFWLLFFVVIPKVSQTAGSVLYPNPSKIAFKQAIEHDVLQIGDSHNPNDPYFRGVRDSLLQAYGVDSVNQLPFNFGGYVMGLGERLTSGIHAEHQRRLTDVYRQQNGFTHLLSLINPYLAIKELSMSLSGTDFETYDDFLLQAEAYRFDLTTHMAKLQEMYVDPKWQGGSEGKRNAIDREEFRRFREFGYQYPSVANILRLHYLPLLSLGFMLLGLLAVMARSSQIFKVS